jgi:hypothetical protein
MTYPTFETTANYVHHLNHDFVDYRHVVNLWSCLLLRRLRLFGEGEVIKAVACGLVASELVQLVVRPASPVMWNAVLDYGRGIGIGIGISIGKGNPRASE